MGLFGGRSRVHITSDPANDPNVNQDLFQVDVSVGDAQGTGNEHLTIANIGTRPEAEKIADRVYDTQEGVESAIVVPPGATRGTR